MALDHLSKNWRLQEELIYTCYQCSRVYQDWITCNTLIQYLHVPFSFEVLMVKIAPTQVSTTLQKKSPRQNFSSPPLERISPLPFGKSWYMQYLLLIVFHSWFLKVVLATFPLVCFACLKDSTYETRKNVSYFTKAFCCWENQILEL